MPRRTMQLYDEWSKIVLANCRDFDARDPDYAIKVSSVVYETIRRLREKRILFQMQLRRDAKEKRRTAAAVKPNP